MKHFRNRYRLDIIHLVRTQNFPKKQHFLPPNAHTYVTNVSFRGILRT